MNPKLSTVGGWPQTPADLMRTEGLFVAGLSVWQVKNRKVTTLPPSWKELTETPQDAGRHLAKLLGRLNVTLREGQ